MKQASTARRSSGQKSKNTTQKKQSISGSRQANSGRSNEGNNRSGSSSRSAARMQNESPANMRPTSATMERGASASRSGRRAAREFQPENGQYLEKFFLDQLKDIYYAEQKIVQSLPKMIEATTTNELREAFEDHLHQTQRHVRRLEKVFEVLGQKVEGKKCEAIEGIVREAEQIIRETDHGMV